MLGYVFRCDCSSRVLCRIYNTQADIKGFVMTSVLGSFGTRLLYRCTFNVDAGTTEEELDRLIEDALKNEAEM